MKQNARKLSYEEIFGEQVFIEKTQNNEGFSLIFYSLINLI